MTADLNTCSLCPRLCRHACPVAVGTGREAAVPAQIAIVLRDWDRGLHPDALAVAASTLCVDCGNCQDACHLHRPFVQAVREVRARLGVLPAPAPLAEIIDPAGARARAVFVGDAAESRAAVLSGALREPVAAWPTSDGLGWRALGGPAWPRHAEAIRERAAGRALLVDDGGCGDALAAAGLAFRWVHEALEVHGTAASCRQGGVLGVGCCGAAGPLASHHPEDAARLAGRVRCDALADMRCAGHLRAQGRRVQDVWDLFDAKGGA